MIRELKAVTLYTDGACSGNPGPGGWAAILMFGAHKKELSGFEEQTTNNRMEMRAVIEGFRALKEPCRVTVYSDSELIINAFNKGWLESWQRNNFKQGKVKNIDLWQQLLQLIQGHDITWVWVKGHADNEFNNRCDELAREQITINK
ncbi:MAG: ribonuclease HI [Firmicutes bacterium]|nr:ribonuclease HI [Bacillota bacterium]